ncbi:MAG: hypothetical protein ACI9MC_000489, partial [Kiritimatiellia bacterium]
VSRLRSAAVPTDAAFADAGDNEAFATREGEGKTWVRDEKSMAQPPGVPNTWRTLVCGATMVAESCRCVA